MQKCFVTIWFRYLKTDWLCRRHPELLHLPFVLTAQDHGRMIITAVNSHAHQQGIVVGMVLADARVIVPSLKYFDDIPGLPEKLLKSIAEWCIRFSPIAAIDQPDGIIIDATGCIHLWNGGKSYLDSIVKRLRKIGYNVNAAMADTPGKAWAIAHFSNRESIINSDQEFNAFLILPVAALRLEVETISRLNKLGLRQIRDILSMPRSVLRRRFGNHLLMRLDQALGRQEEIIQPVQPIEPYSERLPCLEPIITATGIEIALKKLLEVLCERLQHEGKGIRKLIFQGFRMDGNIQAIDIETNSASSNAHHLFKLFEIKISSIEPALGIELFTLEASKVEDIFSTQEKFWDKACGLENPELIKLLDRVTNKIGGESIHRFLPAEHHWPERSVKIAASLNEKMTTRWRTDWQRPIHLLQKPEPIWATALIPDYPPMLFRYKNKVHKVKKADGPERIEREWWIGEGQHRDYYVVEDEDGNRYWLFRSGHYSDENYQWFIHGFFA
ncbi:MAG TPA: DNA polymerase Y family protein [Chitinophagaceae bacterium]|jgi:protein ImuB|nr:DNA polymerase Y family protein [Chitinophagaceae bacterium]